MAKKKKKPSAKKKNPLNRYLEIMDKEGLSELEISDGSSQVKLSKPTAGAPVVQPVVSEEPSPQTEESQPAEANPQDDPAGYKSPIAGVFYRSPSPKSPPFIAEGDTIKAGQPLAIIEAMKVMNEITAERGGRIRKILVENGKPVETGQTLFLIDD